MESRLEELETRYAFQEAALESLSETIHRQQQHLDALILEVAQLRQQFNGMTPHETAAPSDEGPPPHY